MFFAMGFDLNVRREILFLKQHILRLLKYIISAVTT